MSEPVIFAGRFQPFHLGHLHVARAALRGLEARQTLILAAIAPEAILPRGKDEGFAAVAAEHHLPERNPWSLTVRLRALSEVARQLRDELQSDRVAITAIPRPEHGWNEIVAWFPQRRVWVIPQGGEAFDEEKAAYHRQMGDNVVRYDDKSGVSGRRLRELLKQGDLRQLVTFIPACVGEIYCPQV